MAKFIDPIQTARNLRKSMTNEERILWLKLRARKFHGFKFLRQHPIIFDRIGDRPFYFIADFCCAEKKLIIEIDGKIHDFRKTKDKERDNSLKELGFYVLRFKNEDVENNLYEVLNKIKSYLENDSP